MIRNYRHENIELTRMRKIRNIIICGPKKYGGFLNKILARLFGKVKVRDTRMEKQSTRHLAKPGRDRMKTFSSKDVNTLRG